MKTRYTLCLATLAIAAVLLTSKTWAQAVNYSASISSPTPQGTVILPTPQRTLVLPTPEGTFTRPTPEGTAVRATPGTPHSTPSDGSNPSTVTIPCGVNSPNGDFTDVDRYDYYCRSVRGLVALGSITG